MVYTLACQSCWCPICSLFLCSHRVGQWLARLPVSHMISQRGGLVHCTCVPSRPCLSWLSVSWKGSNIARRWSCYWSHHPSSVDLSITYEYKHHIANMPESAKIVSFQVSVRCTRRTHRIYATSGILVLRSVKYCTLLNLWSSVGYRVCYTRLTRTNTRLHAPCFKRDKQSR